jgi:hypothetical protein
MEQPVLKTETPGPLSMLTPEKALGIVWESAVESFVSALLVMVFGSIAIGVVGGIWREMAPSLPPGFTPQPKAEATPPTNWGWVPSSSQHRLLILFGVIFVPTVWARLLRCRSDALPKSRTRLTRITRTLSKQWFGLVVGNAFGAMIAAIVVTSFARFTPLKMLLAWLIDSAAAWFQNVIAWLFGSRTGGALQAWLNWYGLNQLKFTFWFFYLAGICDDLGIPNFKALGRWLKRRYWRQENCAPAAPAKGAD